LWQDSNADEIGIASERGVAALDQKAGQTRASLHPRWLAHRHECVQAFLVKNLRVSKEWPREESSAVKLVKIDDVVADGCRNVDGTAAFRTKHTIRKIFKGEIRCGRHR
jgi:hypothetical protein